MSALLQSILVVEDNPDWQSTIKGILQDAGYLVKIANSISAAQNQLSLSEFDLALLDIRLDESDEENDAGIILAEKISIDWPTVKVIFVTGYANEDFIRKAMEPDIYSKRRLAVNFIQKQKIEGLIPMIQKALERKVE